MPITNLSTQFGNAPNEHAIAAKDTLHFDANSFHPFIFLNFSCSSNENATDPALI